MQNLILCPTDIDHLRLIGHIGPAEEKIFYRTVHEKWPGGVKKYEDVTNEKAGKMALSSG